LTAIWGLLLLGLLAFQINMIFFPKSGEEQPGLAVGLPVPDFTLKSIDGQSFQLNTVAKSKDVLLVFFSSTSQACRIEIGEINDYFKAQTNPAFSVLLISDESADKLADFQKESNLGIPILRDENGAVSGKYKVSEIPANFLVNKERGLTYYQMGSEGFNVYKVQALITTKGKKLELEEKPEAPKAPEQAPEPGKNQ